MITIPPDLIPFANCCLGCEGDCRPPSSLALWFGVSSVHFFVVGLFSEFNERPFLRLEDIDVAVVGWV